MRHMGKGQKRDDRNKVARLRREKDHSGGSPPVG